MPDARRQIQRDLAQAFRRVRRDFWSSVTAVLTLALGAGRWRGYGWSPCRYVFRQYAVGEDEDVRKALSTVLSTVEANGADRSP